MKIIIKPFLKLRTFAEHRECRGGKIIHGENDCNHRFLCITELKENWKTTETRRRQYDRFRAAVRKKSERENNKKLYLSVFSHVYCVPSEKIFHSLCKNLRYLALFDGRTRWTESIKKFRSLFTISPYRRTKDGWVLGRNIIFIFILSVSTNGERFEGEMNTFYAGQT